MTERKFRDFAKAILAAQLVADEMGLAVVHDEIRIPEDLRAEFESRCADKIVQLNQNN